MRRDNVGPPGELPGGPTSSVAGTRLSSPSLREVPEESTLPKSYTGLYGSIRHV